MNYNYPQSQFQTPQAGYGGYRPAPQYPQWGQVQSTSQQVRPVSSIEEVRACPIDFDGSVFYFADMANKRIYTKQINFDGTASINIYELKTDQGAGTSQYVTKQEFENVIGQLYNTFNPLLKPAEEVKPQPTAQQKKPIFEI